VPYKDPEMKKAYQKIYCKEHKEELDKYMKDWRKVHRETRKRRIVSIVKNIIKSTRQRYWRTKKNICGTEEKTIIFSG